MRPQQRKQASISRLAWNNSVAVIGADLAGEIAARMTAKALPVVGGCPAMEPIAPALKGKLEALRAIANRIGPDTWPGCKAELFGVLDAINK